MRKYIGMMAIACGIWLAAAPAAEAQETVQWAPGSGGNACKTFDGTEIDEVGDVILVLAGGRPLTFEVEPNAAGATSAIVIQSWSCTNQHDADTCALKPLDADRDGYPENTSWNGVGDTRGYGPFAVAGVFKLLVTVAPGSGHTPEVRVCGEET